MQIPSCLVIGGVIGYVGDGWPAAIFVAVFTTACAGIGAWLFLRWSGAAAKAGG